MLIFERCYEDSMILKSYDQVINKQITHWPALVRNEKSKQASFRACDWLLFCIHDYNLDAPLQSDTLQFVGAPV